MRPDNGAYGRYWLFMHEAGWAHSLRDLVSQSDTLTDLHEHYQTHDDGTRGASAVLFDLHTGRECSWPVFNDEGDVISSDDALDAHLTDIVEGETCTIAFAHEQCNHENPVQKNIMAYLAAAFRKRFFILIQHHGWPSLGLQDLRFTSDAKSLSYLRRKARLACDDRQVAIIFDTQPDNGKTDCFTEVARVS